MTAQGDERVSPPKSSSGRLHRNARIAGDDHCVMCGASVPEGRMVRGLCEISVLGDCPAKHDLPLRQSRKHTPAKAHH